MQSVDAQVDALLEMYLVHNPDSPVREIVEEAITNPDVLVKMRMLNVLMTLG
ncbi:hypothetical protein ACQ4M4_28275 [Leptolyngbya sp. AN02str]|uniref:hypothetical protein n=1 Tax=Leptolyngbya sp. AN02str TaxID=3423363 RepID=UPI003D31AF3D